MAVIENPCGQLIADDAGTGAQRAVGSPCLGFGPRASLCLSQRAPECHKEMVCLVDPTAVGCRAERYVDGVLFVCGSDETGCRYVGRLGLGRVCRCPARDAFQRLRNSEWLCT
jgi:hypothetical protein